MIIEGEFYRIIPVNEYSNFYDLELLYEIKGKNPRKEYKNVGYGKTLESTIQAIIQYYLSKKFENEVITLKTYLDEYKEVSNKIREEICKR